MARIRSIKPEFWTSEQVAECSPTARLLFVGLWTFADDRGVHPLSLKRMKMEIFPGDSWTPDQMSGWLGELIDAGLVRTFEAQGQWYIAVTGWHHQRIDKPSYKYPAPKFDDHSTTVPRPFDDHSTNTPGPLDPGVEGSGVERSGEEVSISVAAQPQSSRGLDVSTVIDHYLTYHPKAKPGAKERRLITDRLKEKYSAEELCEAIDGCHRSPHHCGETNGTKYQSLTLIMRDSSHVQQFLDLADEQRRARPAARDERLEFEMFQSRYIREHPDRPELRQWPAEKWREVYERFLVYSEESKTAGT